MPISSKVNRDIHFLHDLDANKFSIGRESNGLTKINRRSSFWTFFWGVVHYVTFKYIPRNRELDRIARETLKEIEDELGNATDKERLLAEKAVRNLNTILSNNGGSEGPAVEKMLETIAKIEELAAVKKLSGNVQGQGEEFGLSEPKDAPEASPNPERKIEEVEKNDNESLEDDKPEDSPKAEPVTVHDPGNAPTEGTQLKSLLQDLIKTNGSSVNPSSDIRAKQADGQLLPNLHESVLLTQDELALLLHAFEQMEPQFLIRNLSPDLVSSIVLNSLLNSNLGCLTCILEAMEFEPLDAKQITAFANGFDHVQDRLKQGAVFAKIDTQQIQKFLSQATINPDIISSFKTHLSQDELRNFSKNIAELVLRQAQDDPQEIAPSFREVVYLTHKFGPEYEETSLRILCLVQHVSLLKEILTCTKAVNLAIEIILKNNPSPQNGSKDIFFQQLVDQLDATEYTAITDSFFRHASLERQQILTAQLSPEVIAQHLEVIPTTLIEDLEDNRFSEVAEAVESSQRNKPNDQQLKTLAKAVKANRLTLMVDDYMLLNLVASLLPLCDVKIQIQFVSDALGSAAYNHRTCLKKIKLPLPVWEEASKLDQTRQFSSYELDQYTPDIAAQIVNGQIGNSKYLRSFFRVFFGAKEKLEKQREYLEYLKPGVFDFDQPQGIQHPVWYQFFTALREMPDQKKAQLLLIRSTLHLFNHPDFSWLHRECLYALTQEQMKLLPIDQYTKPEIRLLLACLTDRLDDGLIATANDLSASHGGSFFDFFEPAYVTNNKFALEELDFALAEIEQNDICAFKTDIQYLKNFLSWVCNRPSIHPVLATWNWINDYHADALLRKDIQDDLEIQKHMTRLGLEVKT